MLTRLLKTTQNSLKATHLKPKPNSQSLITLKHNFGKRYTPGEPTPLTEQIPDGNQTLDPNTLETYTDPTNYNFEEHPDFHKRVEYAQSNRDLIKEIRQNPVIPRRQRYVYDRPLYDDDISEYEVWREFSDSIITKEYPHDNPPVVDIMVSPRAMVHVFGESVENFRNDTYSTKEWDFMDSNLDRFIVYDYKGTTEYWGENHPDEWYEVSTNNSSEKVCSH